MNTFLATFLSTAMLLMTIPVFGQDKIPDSTMVTFELQDQFDREYSDQSWPDKIIVLIGSDRGGSQFNAPWGEQIYLELQIDDAIDEVQIIGLADLRGVPFFLKGFVKGKFPRDRERWVLMDWDGQFAHSYNFEKDVSNILVFNAAGDLVYQTSAREPQPEKLSEIVAVIRDLLPERQETVRR